LLSIKRNHQRLRAIALNDLAGAVVMMGMGRYLRLVSDADHLAAVTQLSE
jgi:hypothetical protein